MKRWKRFQRPVPAPHPSPGLFAEQEAQEQERQRQQAEQNNPFRGMVSSPEFGAVASSFIRSTAPVRVLTGPVGSGKSSAAAFALAQLAIATRPGRDGVRRSRSIIIRNTYRELEDSCLKTWFRWVPRELGHWHPSDMRFSIAIPGRHSHDFMFRAFDSAGDVGKLLSTEYSYAWLSEARELPEELIHMLPARLRYPTQRDCPGFRGSILIESNPSDLSHWLYKMTAEERGEGWDCFAQPSGLDPAAENLANLPPNYYRNLVAGRPPMWVDCFVHGKWVFYSSDLAVFPEWIQSRHVAPAPILPIPGQRVIVGMDFGLTPAAAFVQRAPSGQYRVIDELCTDNMGARRFGDEARHLLNTRYRGCESEIWGDPAGTGRAQSDESTPYQMLAAAGIDAAPTHTNDWTIRREAVASLLTGNCMDGGPALIVSPTCKVLMRGMAGDYRYQRIQVSGTARYSQIPVKSASSHICDALEYAMLGAGEDIRVMGGGWSTVLDKKLRTFTDGNARSSGNARRGA